jgi:hypothetical protein
MINKVLHFIANSPLGSALKVGVGSGLVFILDNISDFNLSPLISAAVIAGVNVAINWLNPKDARYGRTVAGE